MSRTSGQKDISLKALEIFAICGAKGSLQAAADETGLSISTVSHHLRSLEEHLGVALMNHGRRPMGLTPKGERFLRGIEGALYAIRKARAEASSGGVAEAASLRLGTIEDLDSDIIPQLAVYLSERMKRCDFLYHTDTSHRIIQMLRDRQLDVGITSAPSEKHSDLHETPLLRDPFVVVTPRVPSHDAEAIVKGASELPFLRFSGNLMIGKQIEGQMRRLGLSHPHRFACGNHQTLMAMVAAGAGWTLTTPLLFAHAVRFQPDLQMHRFPDKSFARHLSLVSTPDCSASMVAVIAAKTRALLKAHAIGPQVAAAPWLKDQFTLLEAGSNDVEG